LSRLSQLFYRRRPRLFQVLRAGLSQSRRRYVCYSAPRTPRSLIKLTPYNGTGRFETFLAKFENMAQYLGWNDVDRYYHLCACLEGAAGQVLWDAGPPATTESIISLLRTRFGNESQAERFKAELRARRRKPVESAQQLCLDICRLVAVAYLTSEPALVNHMAKEAFITALGDAINCS